MTAAKEYPRVAPSLPADAIPGAGALTKRLCRTKHTPLPSFMRIRMLFALDSVRTDLTTYAFSTDRPERRLVELADCLDTAIELLDMPNLPIGWFGLPEFSDAIKGGGP